MRGATNDTREMTKYKMSDFFTNIGVKYYKLQETGSQEINQNTNGNMSKKYKETQN